MSIMIHQAVTNNWVFLIDFQNFLGFFPHVPVDVNEHVTVVVFQFLRLIDLPLTEEKISK